MAIENHAGASYPIKRGRMLSDGAPQFAPSLGERQRALVTRDVWLWFNSVSK